MHALFFHSRNSFYSSFLYTKCHLVTVVLICVGLIGLIHIAIPQTKFLRVCKFFLTDQQDRFRRLTSTQGHVQYMWLQCRLKFLRLWVFKSKLTWVTVVTLLMIILTILIIYIYIYYSHVRRITLFPKPGKLVNRQVGIAF